MIRCPSSESDSSSPLMMIVVGRNESEHELFQVVRNVSAFLDSMESTGRTVTAPLLFVDGFNHDARELHEIPEAITVLKRALKAGFVSVLHCSTMLAPPLGQQESRAGAFGAFELWAIATGRLEIRNNRAEIDRALITQFFEKVLPQENQRLRNRITRWQESSQGGSLC